VLDPHPGRRPEGDGRSRPAVIDEI